MAVLLSRSTTTSANSPKNRQCQIALRINSATRRQECNSTKRHQEPTVQNSIKNCQYKKAPRSNLAKQHQQPTVQKGIKNQQPCCLQLSAELFSCTAAKGFRVHACVQGHDDCIGFCDGLRIFCWGKAVSNKDEGPAAWKAL